MTPFLKTLRTIFPPSILIPVIIITTGCNTGSGSGGIALVVKNARGPAPVEENGSVALAASAVLPPELQVASFRIVVSGEDFPAIEAVFPAETTEGSVGNIPAGRERTVLIEALNSAGEAVRRRSVAHVEIVGGRTTSVAATLVAVPRFTSIREGRVITASRLVLEGYGEPGSGLELNDRFGDTTYSISEIPAEEGSASSSPVITPSLSAGFFSMKPPVLQPGVHTFELKDPQTGESASVTVTLVPAGRRPGTWVGSMGGLAATHTTSAGMTEPLGSPGFVLPLVLQEDPR